MFSDRLQNYAQEKFNLRLPVLGTLRDEIETKLNGCSREEQILMKFLYGTMPLRDAAEYEFQVFLGFVRHSLMVFQTMDWCRGIPEDMFLHHILYYRINSEQIEDCRPFFYDQLKGRIAGMTAGEAVLEINYWCAENGSYEASDQRTISPMTLYRSGKGRCGEESTFAVTAFRSVGIPARQVYTPRWAHCDDNHAWVEVYVDGAWHFLGACEPEEVLDKGWFTNASSRALLVHTRTFSDYTSGQQEECLGQEELLFYYNDTSAYALTKLYEITVRDQQQRPVGQALVSVEIMNSGEYNSVAELYTDGEGKARITLGQGDIHLTVIKDGIYAETLGKVKDTDGIVITLPDSENNRDWNQWKDTDIQAPGDYPMHPVILTREQKEKNRQRLRAAGKLREERISGYFQADLAEPYPEEKEILTLAAGNFPEICQFLRRDQNPDRKPLLHSLAIKDYKDAKGEILEGHLQSAWAYRKVWEEKNELEVYEKYILCPRIFYEELTDYRGVIKNYFSPAKQQEFKEDARRIWRYIEDHIGFEPALDYSTIFWTPPASLKIGQGNPMSKKILFVAICRTLGIPARINTVNLEAEYYRNGTFMGLSDPPETSVPTEPEKGGKTSVLLTTEEGDGWLYYQTWTIGKQHRARFVTLDYTGITFREGKLRLELEPGTYRLLTSSRLPNGNQLVSQYVFSLEEQETRTIEMRRRNGNMEELLVSNQLEDFDLIFEGDRTTAAKLTENHANILAFLSEGQEPTEHVLNEMLDQRDLLKTIKGDIWFILESRDALENRTLKKVLETLPHIKLAYGAFGDIVEPLARRMYVDPDKLPLLLVTDRGLHGIYGCSGYNVGSVNVMVKMLELSV